MTKKFKVELYVVTKVVTYEKAESKDQAEWKAVDHFAEHLANSTTKLITGEYEEIKNVHSTECEPLDPRFDIFGFDDILK